MKYLMMLIAMFLFAGATVQAQQSVKKADTDQNVGYTYDYDKVLSEILARIEKPGDKNAYVQALLDTKGFPEYKNAIKENRKAFLASLKTWMEANPSLIIETFKHRSDIVTPFAK